LATPIEQILELSAAGRRLGFRPLHQPDQGPPDATVGPVTASPPPPFVLLPAVDVAGGLAVRLVQGEAGTETSYGAPVEAALAWQDGGAQWVHVVDLDAAFGRGTNRELIAVVVGRLDVAVELSGGIRDDDSLAAALATGCARVNLGTAALERPDWVRAAIARHGDRIAVGLDVRGTTLSARGWTQDGGELFEVLARLDADGCARYVVTDVRRDGTLTGPNLDLLGDVCAATDRPVIASGGVSSLDDLRALARLRPAGVEGAIVGKALYAGAFTLPEAIAAVASNQ
jgi:1-(5-phosphoribosyl)-5-[(5-phosphoribosylamino)methylideneamino] imidazole-4-carboxamide isomerase/N-(5'phosphoribosyl)anthranilate isomerase